MYKVRSESWVRYSLFSTLFVSAQVLFSGCLGGGSTDGGGGRDDVSELNGSSLQYIADGGAGASMSLEVPSVISVGGTADFVARLRDPRGLPLDYVRVACDSEKGVAILEPSSGGVAFEHTSVSGNMSGVLGGLLPGSYVIECRAPDGFGLVARQSVQVSGETPSSFTGFPGAAGGNLGGGSVVDQNGGDDDVDPSLEPLRIAKMEVSDGEDKVTSGPIDIVRGECKTGEQDEDGKDKTEPEPWYFNKFYLTLANDTSQKVTVGTIGFSINDGRSGATSTQSKIVVVDSAQTGEVDGILTEFSTSGKVFAGTTNVVRSGTYKVDVVLTGVYELSGDFVLRRSFTLTFGNVNNCPST